MSGTELHHSHKIPPFKALQSRFSVILPILAARRPLSREKLFFQYSYGINIYTEALRVCKYLNVACAKT